MKKIIVFVLSILMIFSINILAVFASDDLPYFETVRKEEIKLYGAPVSLDIKNIMNVENKKVQKQINCMINDYVNSILKKQGAELKQNPQMNYVQLGIGVSDYYISQELVSLSLDFLEIMADSYEVKEYHTINLKTGEEYKISQWLGKDYAQIVKDVVLKQINEQNEKNGNDLYFMDEVNNLKITEDQSYYINKDGYVVVTFPKYVIAPGYLGLPEFIMPIHIKGVS